MTYIAQELYRGWEITIRCSAGKSSAAYQTSYTAVASAELLPGQNPADWIDPRIQLVTTGNRSFAQSAGCLEVLLLEVRQLIDALQKQT